MSLHEPTFEKAREKTKDRSSQPWSLRTNKHGRWKFRVCLPCSHVDLPNSEKLLQNFRSMCFKVNAHWLSSEAAAYKPAALIKLQ